MSVEVWAAWPTINIERSLTMIDLWQRCGYKVAILINPPFEHTALPTADRVIVQKEWSGFPAAANILCRETPGNIVVVVGDDVYPDPRVEAEKIGVEFVKRFPDTFGVMQPIGDKFAWTHKCAVSPWIGRAFIEKAYDGQGPFWPEYFHYFSDQELQEYAIMKKAFQQRDDLAQFHDHWQRKENPKRPRHLRKAKRMWAKDKAVFDSRKKKGFPHGINQ